MIGLALLAAAAATCPAPQGWAKPARHVAARSADMKFALPANGSSAISLLPAKTVKLAAASSHKAKPGTSAGLAAIDVPKAGKLDVVLSTATYVDLVRDGKVLQSSGHAMTRGCTGMRKDVTFDVTPGRYIVQLTDAPGRSVTMGTILH